jgi:nucleoside 2-deoxyribosyltransferase
VDFAFMIFQNIIADLTHDNNGAYWEAGYAEGLGKPVIYFCDKSKFDNPPTKPHFDTNHHTTVLWNKEKVEESIEDLKSTIKATFPKDAIL